MDILKKAIGIFLILGGIAVAVHLIVEPLYHTSTEADPSSPLWQAFHPVVIAIVVLTFIFSYLRKRDVEQVGVPTRWCRGTSWLPMSSSTATWS